MDVFLLSLVAALLVFVVARFVKVRLTILGWLGAGVLAVLAAWLIQRIADFADPVKITTDWVVIPVVTLAIGAILVGLLLKVARPLR